MVAGVQWNRYTVGGLSQVLLMAIYLWQYLDGISSAQALIAGMGGAMAVTVTLAVMHRRKRHPYPS